MENKLVSICRLLSGYGAPETLSTCGRLECSPDLLKVTLLHVQCSVSIALAGTRNVVRASEVHNSLPKLVALQHEKVPFNMGTGPVLLHTLIQRADVRKVCSEWQ